jgi:hypothetical protein
MSKLESIYENFKYEGDRSTHLLICQGATLKCRTQSVIARSMQQYEAGLLTGGQWPTVEANNTTLRPSRYSTQTNPAKYK